MGVMICLGQGGLRCPSASIFFLLFKTAGSVEMAGDADSSIVLTYISTGIKASFLKENVFYIYIFS